MTLRKPLVLNNGQIQQIQSGDILDATIIETEQITLTNAESSNPIVAGMVVYLSAASSVKKAKADAAGTKEVIAFCKDASVTSGQTGAFVTSGQLSVADWTAALGSANLTAGAIYYLSGATGGFITATAPVAGYVVEVGVAISTTVMQIRTNRPIQL